jgi:hypothetical protein
MRAYGAPKYFGASGEGKQQADGNSVSRNDGLKVGTGMSIANANGSAVGQYQVRGYVPPKKY